MHKVAITDGIEVMIAVITADMSIITIPVRTIIMARATTTIIAIITRVIGAITTPVITTALIIIITVITGHIITMALTSGLTYHWDTTTARLFNKVFAFVYEVWHCNCNRYIKQLDL